MESLIKHLMEIGELIKRLRTSNLPSLELPSPSPDAAPKLPAIPGAPTVKKPSASPGSKKNPVKQAQQIQDPNKKANALKNAKDNMTISSRGQWALKAPAMAKEDKEDKELDKTFQVTLTP